MVPVCPDSRLFIGKTRFKSLKGKERINTTFAVQFIKDDTKGQSDGKFNDNLFAWVISLKFDKRCQNGKIIKFIIINIFQIAYKMPQKSHVEK